MDSSSAPKRPNFLIVVADDLGFSDVAPYGGEIKTPVLEKLAREGIRMTNFHTASACSPTRSMLLSGTDNHIAGLGQMMEHMAPNKHVFEGKPGYEGYLNMRVAALPEILQDAGYLTMMSGKWHLGLTKEFAPCSRGFTHNFSFLPGSGNHHAYEPQLDSGDPDFNFLNTDKHWMEGERFINRKTDVPKDFYSTKSFTDKLLDYFEGRTEKEKDQPFFAYLPFTAPHWPLQAPKEVVDRYAGVYDDGPDKLRERRLQRLIELGLVSKDVEAAPMIPKGASWADMSVDERKASAKKMEVFAAMVEVIDDNIGRVVDYLEATGELDNTFVLFMSDNGAEGVAMEALPVMGGPRTMGSIINKYYDNSYENIGNPDSFIWYGPQWASAATAPSRGLKSYVLEGGIRCPCIVRYPPFTNSSQEQGQTRTSAVTKSFTTVMDILPTVLELAQVSHPGTTFRGREVALPRGKSWCSHLGSSQDDATTSVHGEDTHVHGWELFAQRAIRQGQWKAVWQPAPRGTEEWELYNVEEDPGELHDRAAEKQDLLETLLEHWARYFAETGMFDAPPEAIGKKSL